MFAHRENGLFQLGSVRALDSFSGASSWERLSSGAQARQEGGGASGSFPAIFSLYTNPELKPLLGELPHLESPFPRACLPGTDGFKSAD